VLAASSSSGLYHDLLAHYFKVEWAFASPCLIASINRKVLKVDALLLLMDNTWLLRVLIVFYYANYDA